MSKLPMRPRGRPATENLGRFYLATGLLGHDKTLKLKLELAIPDREAFVLIARLFEFAATFAGSSGYIPRASYEALGRFCFWDGDPFLLVSAFRRAGFIDNEGEVHGWLEFQPDAAKRAARRVVKQDPETGRFCSDKQEQEALPSVSSNIHGITENINNHKSTDPPGIMENINQHNSQKSETQEKQEPEVLAQDLLSLNSESIEYSTRSDARASARNFGGEINDLLGDLANKADGKQKLGPLKHLAELVFKWSGTAEPTPGDLANLRLAAVQIGPDGVERLVRDFEARGYEPANKLAALFGAARREYQQDPETAPQSASGPEEVK